MGRERLEGRYIKGGRPTADREQFSSCFASYLRLLLRLGGRSCFWRRQKIDIPLAGRLFTYLVSRGEASPRLEVSAPVLQRPLGSLMTYLCTDNLKSLNGFLII